MRFSFNDRYVLSAGGEDLTVFVWRIGTAPTAKTATGGAQAETGATVSEAVYDDDEGEEDDGDDSDVEADVERDLQVKSRPKGGGGGDDDDDDDDVYLTEEPSAGEQLGALKPYLASIKPPTNAPAAARAAKDSRRPPRRRSIDELKKVPRCGRCRH